MDAATESAASGATETGTASESCVGNAQPDNPRPTAHCLHREHRVEPLRRSPARLLARFAVVSRHRHVMVHVSSHACVPSPTTAPKGKTGKPPPTEAPKTELTTQNPHAPAPHASTAPDQMRTLPPLRAPEPATSRSTRQLRTLTLQASRARAPARRGLNAATTSRTLPPLRAPEPLTLSPRAASRAGSAP